MKISREREVKLEVAEHFVLPELATVAGVHEVNVVSRSLGARYFDTPDLRLARSGVTLRHRTGEGRPTWTLKVGAVTAAGLDREEISVPGAAARMPAELVELLTARLRGATLAEVVRLRTRRTALVLLDGHGDELVELADDHVVAVRPGADEQEWHEIEVEERTHGAAAAAQVVELLRRAGASLTDQTPKAVRALGLQAAEPELVVPEVGRKDPAGLLVRRSLVLGIARLLQHDVGVRRGAEDAVHQVRVSCRRLRSELKTFGPLVADDRVDGLREELAWLADSMGAARDLEVLRQRLFDTAALEPRLDIASVDVLLVAQEEEALAAGQQALRSKRYLALLDLLHALANDIQLSPLAEDSCRSVVPGLVGHEWDRLAKRVRRLTLSSPDHEWHRARIQAKRARYAAEAAEAALGKDVRAMAKASKQLQELLGDHQDGVVTAAQVLALAEEHPKETEFGVLCGRLAERERAGLRTLRAAFLKERKALLARGSG